MSSAPLEKTHFEPAAPSAETPAVERALSDLDYGWHGNNRVI